MMILNEFVADLSEKAEVNTVNSYCTSLKKYYNYNVVDKVDTRKIRLFRKVNEHTAPNSLSKKDIQRLLLAIEVTEKNENKKNRNLLIVELMLKAGLRISEVQNLKINDIDLKDKKIYIRKSKGNVSRKIPMHNSIEKILKKYQSSNKTNLFKISDRAIRNVVYKYALMIDVNISPHSLRHTFAIRLRQEGEKLENISYLLGHANIETTKLYLKVSEDILRDTINKI